MIPGPYSTTAASQITPYLHASIRGKTNIDAALSVAREGGMGKWSDGTPVKPWIETSSP